MARPANHASNGADVLMDDGFRERFLLAWRLLRDDRVSPLKYVLPIALAAYIVSPVDTIPDVFLGVGQIDDVGIVIVALMLFVRIMPWLAPREVVADHASGTGREATWGMRNDVARDDALEADFRIRARDAN